MKKPNIVMIVADQQRRDTIGAYGNSFVKTPSIDRLAAEGIIFQQAFTPCGLCSPVRTSLLTGVFPHKHEVLTNVTLHPIRNRIEPKDDVLFSGMKKAGYRMGYVGKWHVSNDHNPEDFGCETYVSLGDYYTFRKNLGVAVPPETNNYLVPVAATDPIPAEQSRPAWLTDRALDLIDRFAEDNDHPFFLRLDFHGPHMPMVIPEPYASMYDPRSIEQFPNFDDDLNNKPAVQKIKRQHWKTEEMSWEEWQPLLAKYYGEISLLDHQVGRVQQKLDQLGLDENTMVIYTTDHGDTMGAHKIWNKDYTMYDEIYRVPFIVKWPEVILSGARCNEYIHHFIDLTATFLDIAGVSAPHQMDGQSLLPLLHGQTQNRKREAYAQFHGCHMGLYTMRMLQTDRYKYIFHTNDISELYDHKNDPYELNNCAEDESYAEVVKEMCNKMVEWMKETEDHLYNEWIVYWLTGDRDKAIKAPGRTNTPW
jgi:arylsulfatase A-like enzyme